MIDKNIKLENQRLVKLRKQRRQSFSERNGYVISSEVMILEEVPKEVANAISSALCRVFQRLKSNLWIFPGDISNEQALAQSIWADFMNEDLAKFDLMFDKGYKDISNWITSDGTLWYSKLDLVEFIVDKLSSLNKSISEQFVEEINEQFQRLKFGYRIVSGTVIDIVSEDEIKSVQTAIDNSVEHVAGHLKKALALHSKRPKPDYANSIKESISAVEAYLRGVTGKNKFSDAMKEWQRKYSNIHPILYIAMDKLHGYTNQPDVGARHALMDSSSEYIPQSSESLYMLVTCSAFINYLRSKSRQSK